jgi:hypothetical protein
VETRLYGTAAQTAATVEALRLVLDLTSVSRPYPDRPPSRLHRALRHRPVQGGALMIKPNQTVIEDHGALSAPTLIPSGMAR